MHEVIRAHAPTAICRLLEGMPDELYENYKASVVEVLQDKLQKKTRDRDVVVQSAVLAFGLLGDADEDDTDASIRALLAKIPKLVPDQQTRRFSLIAMAKAAATRATSEPFQRPRKIRRARPPRVKIPAHERW